MKEDRSYYSHPNGDRREHYTIFTLAFPKFYMIESRVVYGMNLPDPEGVRHVLPADAPAEDIGAALRDALKHARFIPPWHPRYDELMDAPGKQELVTDYDAGLRRIAGVKTNAALYRGSKCVVLSHEVDHGEITLHAFSRRSGRNHWTKAGDPQGNEVISAEADDAALGAVYLKALAQGGQVS